MNSTIATQIPRLELTVFEDLSAIDEKKIHHKEVTWKGLCKLLRNPPEYPDKKSCLLLKLAVFGNVRSEKNSLRHDKNMLQIFGVELDYDGELVSIQEAAAMLQAAGVKAFFYTSASHTPAKPRWRTLVPLSTTYAPSERRRFVKALDTLLGNIAASESYTASQGFYFGKVAGGVYETAETHGQPIDLVAAATFAGESKPITPHAQPTVNTLPGFGPIPAHIQADKLDDTTRNLLAGPPKRFEIILQKSLDGTGCRQLANICDPTTQSAQDYNRWIAGLSIASSCEDCETAIHKISRHDKKRYDHAATIKKAAEFKDKPYRCDTFQANWPQHCEGCEHKGKLTSPIQLGCEADVGHNSTSGADTAAIARLAALPKLEYDRVRTREAKALGVRTSSLDEQVAAARAARQQAQDSPYVEIDPWPEPIDLAALLNEISTTIRRYIVCEKEVADAATLWAAMSYVVDALLIAPLVIISSPEKRCGKSEFRRLMAKLVYRPLEADGMSASVLFRGFDLWKPTLLVDEFDTFVADDESLRGVFNAGHQRGGCIWRCAGEDHTPMRFDVFGPKLLAGIGKLPGTIEDRAIIFQLRRKLSHERVERLRNADEASFDRVRRKLMRFAQDQLEAIRDAQPALPEELNDRQQDNWHPLCAIADLAGHGWPERARQAALKLSGGVETAASIEIELLADIQEVFAAQSEKRIFSHMLAFALCKDLDRPWATYNRGQPITPSQIAKKLKPFGIAPKTVRIGAENLKGYEKAQFVDAWQRYLPSAVESAGAETAHPN